MRVANWRKSLERKKWWSCVAEFTQLCWWIKNKIKKGLQSNCDDNNRQISRLTVIFAARVPPQRRKNRGEYSIMREGESVIQTHEARKTRKVPPRGRTAASKFGILDLSSLQATTTFLTLTGTVKAQNAPKRVNQRQKPQTYIKSRANPPFSFS